MLNTGIANAIATKTDRWPSIELGSGEEDRNPAVPRAAFHELPYDILPEPHRPAGSSGVEIHQVEAATQLGRYQLVAGKNRHANPKGLDEPRDSEVVIGPPGGKRLTRACNGASTATAKG